MRTRVGMALLIATTVVSLVAHPSIGRAEEEPASGVPEAGRPARGSKVLIASTLYPGLGQLMNGKEHKAAIVSIAEAALVAGLVVEDRRARNALRLYEETREFRYYNDYSLHFDRRQTLIWWAVIAALYGLTDAYVDAHLSGFEETAGRRIEGGFERSAGGGGGIRIGLSLRF